MPYGMALPSSLSGKSCTLTRSGCPAGGYSRPAVLELARRVPSSWRPPTRPAAPRPRELADLPGEVAELGVPVGVLAPSMTLVLPCRLKPIACSIRATVRSDTGCPLAVSAPARFRGRLGRPHQRRHRIPAGLRLHQRLQRAPPAPGRSRSASCGHRPAPAPAPTARPTLDLTHPTGDRVRMHPGRRRHRLDPAPAQLLSLAPQQQPTLPLIQMRPQQPRTGAPPTPPTCSRSAIAQP